MKRLATIWILAIALISLNGIAFADTPPTPGPADKLLPTAIGVQTKLPTSNFKEDIVPSAIKIFLAISGALSVIVFVYAGIMLIIAQGNEEEVTKFKSLLIWALVGTVFVTISYALVRGIMQLVFT